uniref:Biogenesis of lysosome-related organelles complex 1 subunit 2 n=1 Tax=Samia ricini TaxID=63990 RepID=A0A2Z6DSH9_SAMRI|nr:biogenesis of lysosome-related organelles complex 1 subunit 2 [Samia ricini]
MSMSEEEIEKWTVESRNKELPSFMSASSFEVLDPHDPVISRLATQLFKKTNDYLQGEITSGQEHYTLLEDLNRLTITKYADLRNLVSNLNKSLVEYNDFYIQQIKPLLQQIDFIDSQVTKFEAFAYRLDSYTKQLKARFKELDDN